MALNSVKDSVLSSPVYTAGQTETRAWGSYTVTATKDNGQQGFCEKTLNILPRRALSLQRHSLRTERWQITQGALTVIINDKVLNLCAGDWVEIPRAATHSIINLGLKPAVVLEHQRGMCREEDNDRLHDYIGRPAVPPCSKDAIAQESLRIYKAIIRLL